MAKELPYFKFHVSEWINGDITLESLEEQGAFINICAYYWFKDGHLTLAEAKRRLTQIKATAFQSLIKKGFLKQTDGFLKISFLDQQLSERDQTSIKNSQNGKLGGRPKRKPNESDRFILGKPNESQTKANIKPIREEKRREEQEKIGDVAQKVNSFLQRKGTNTMDVTMMVTQWINEGVTDIMVQLQAMKAYYLQMDWKFPTKIETLTQSLPSADWVVKLKESDPQHKAERKANGNITGELPALAPANRPGALDI